MEYITMRNGTKVPMLGLGCYKSEEQEGVEAVKSAIEIGYRHIDTANFYENEKYVGRGIRESGIDREKLFVVSKIWPTSFKTPEVAIEYSMRALNIDYVDSQRVDIHHPKVVHFRPCRYRLVQDRLQIHCNDVRPSR